jgi:hypothetical protein
MWLTLPGAAMCSIPIGVAVGPRLLSQFGVVFPAIDGIYIFAVALMLIPTAAVTSRKAYKHSTSTVGHPGIRIVLMVFNLMTQMLADLCILLFCLGLVLAILGPIIVIIFK